MLRTSCGLLRAGLVIDGVVLDVAGAPVIGILSSFGRSWKRPLLTLIFPWMKIEYTSWASVTEVSCHIAWHVITPISSREYFPIVVQRIEASAHAILRSPSTFSICMEREIHSSDTVELNQQCKAGQIINAKEEASRQRVNMRKSHLIIHGNETVVDIFHKSSSSYS